MKTETLLLKFLDLLQPVYRLAGVDYEKLRAIVGIKLKMDNRRQMMSFGKKENTDSGNNFLKTLLYSIFGGFVAIFMYNMHSAMMGMTIFFSYIMVMIAMTLITDFSSILLDTSDITIILPRPVDGRTLFAARLTHIMLYLGQLTLGLSLLPAVVVGIKFGAVVLSCFSIVIVLAVFMAMLVTTAMYLLIMQFANKEKLKNTINSFQIIMAVIVMGGYQLMPRIMGRYEFEDYIFKMEWWSYLIPPIWMGGTMEAVLYHSFDVPHLILIGLCIIVPVGGLYLTNQHLSPIFTKKISALENETPQARQTDDPGKKYKSNVVESLSAWVTTNAVERAAFELVYKILGRDRKIKLKIYPSVGYILIFGLLLMMQGKDDIGTLWHNLPMTQYYFGLIYLAFMVVQVALHEISYSDDFKASWFYSSAPLERPGEILAGMVKAIYAKLFIPLYSVIALFIFFVWGFDVVGDVLFGLLNNFLILLIASIAGRRILPLTLASSAKNQAGNFVRGLMTLVFMIVPAGLHYLLSKWPLVLWGTIPIQLGISYFILRSLKDTKWKSIYS